ncbi:hypothetical protein LMH87_005932 [Akanthomyces muscarius]|uniref:DUF8004 domain-containing protein n=1 Tax=Akanthomyces muscarius TaxID=2231603 RepID=A0A9W8QLQ9_AKAMU|nr:hypothetical protein LMH87_005932 [Akanthomyces muscarius]KAJ4164251.1 hypothetical protein LMH87_005932 [Akanthomyces muscarius]
MTSTTDLSSASIRRKPVGLPEPGKLSPTETPPPPPYKEYDSKHSPPIDPLDTTANTGSERSTSPPPLSVDAFLFSNNNMLPQSATMPILRTEIPHSALGIDEQPQIASATSSIAQSSYEAQLPPLQEIAPQKPASRDGSPDEGAGDLRGPRKLRKNSGSPKRPRANSYQAGPSIAVPGLRSSSTMPLSDLRGRSVSSHPTLSVTEIGAPPSMPPPPIPRPSSRGPSPKRTNQSPNRGRLRKSWMPGGRSRSNSIEVSSPNAKMQAWIMTDENTSEYNPTFLKNAEKVPELWNENGHVLVYLYPRGSGCGPSFKVPEFTISSSYLFNELLASEPFSAVGQPRSRSFGGRDSLSVDDASRIHSPPTGQSEDFSSELKLYLPVARPSASTHLVAPGEGGDNELDRLIAIRNLFAFLTGQPLVGTKSRPTVFMAFLEIAELLEEYSFTGIDGTGFGNAVDLSFSFYSDFLGLSDCRHSREKTIEALILGERMRNVDLYNEAFAHAAGKYSAIIDLRLSLFDKISPLTRQRLERAHIDLVNRQHNVNDHLEQFEFPSIFAGTANSTSISEMKNIRFKVWRNSFTKMRSFMLSYYKSTFGSWPPKASSKKNPFMESGLNRLVLKMLYSDMCALYDLLVDRTDLTSRVIDHMPELSSDPEKITRSAIRNIMSEYDRSRPPVLPPIPFDLPQLPTVQAIHETYSSLSAKDQAKFDKKLKEHELLLILNKAYNYDTNGIKLPFLDQFKEFESREAKGKMKQDIIDQRIGYWIFLYAVLQSLPMLVVDAPGLKHTEGTEYFLCQPPMGQPPWAVDGQVRKQWYEVAGGGGLVELSTDAVMYSVEATYHRSHCWLAAKQWEGLDGADQPPPEPIMSPLEPPRAIFEGGDGVIGSPPPIVGPSTPSPPLGTPPLAVRPRNLSPGRGRASSAFRSSIVIGLEPVPMDPPTSVFGPHQRSSSLGPRPPSAFMGSRSISGSNLVGMSTPRTGTPTTIAPTSGTTFDDILAGGTDDKNKGKQKEKEKEKEKKPSKKKGFFF